MYIGTLVEETRKVIDNLRSKRGDFSLAMLYNSAGLNTSSNWNLIVSAPWTDEIGKFDSTHVVAQALHDGLDSEHQLAVSRVTILKTDDPFVRDVNFLYPVSPGGPGIPVTQVTAGDVSEGGGYVLSSRHPEPRPLVSQSGSKSAR